MNVIRIGSNATATSCGIPKLLSGSVDEEDEACSGGIYV